MNLLPVVRGSGMRVTYIAPDWSEARIKLPLNWRTRNYVGTIYGGSMYSAVDPHYMLLLIHRLGPAYLVWDKAASIRFRRPGRATLYATVQVRDDEVEEIKRLLTETDRVDRTYHVDLVDAQGVVHANVEKVVQVRNKPNVAHD